ncbi:MAG: TolB family protein, partial [Pirellula sp.]
MNQPFPSRLALSSLLALAMTSTMTDPTFAQTKERANIPPLRPATVEDLFRWDRYAEPQLSPDGQKVVYQSTHFLDPTKNSKTTQLWLQDGNAPPIQITRSNKSDTHPRFSPDGEKILFESNRDGTSQLYVLDLTTPGEARKLT